MVNKLTSFQTFVYSSSFHIYVLKETWLSSLFLKGELIPTGFSIYRRDRKSRGGGVMVAVHNSLSSRQLFSPPHLEVLTVEVSVSSPILICVVYIPPSCNSNYYSEVFRYLDSTISQHPRSVIIGDFNLPDISWFTLSDQSPSSIALCELAFCHNLLQLVDFPTHIMGNILDLVLTSSDNLVHNLSKVSSEILCSDHCIFSFNLSTICSLNTSQACNFSTFDYKKTDFDKLFPFLFDVDFSPLLTHLT